MQARPDRDLPSYIIGELGRVGDAETVALLHAYLPDPDLGPLAVKAIRTIERRLAGNALSYSKLRARMTRIASFVGNLY